MATDAIREARALLLEQRQTLTREIERITDELERTKKAIGALDDLLGPLVGVVVVSAPEPVEVSNIAPTVHGKTNTRPFIAQVLRAHPGKHHAKQITQWMDELITQTAKNPVNANGTTLLRMQRDGLVKNHGGNIWEWIGDRDGEEVQSDSAPQ